MAPSSYRGVPRVKLLCALVASCFAAEGLANPTGPAVAAGAASFSTAGKTLTVTNSPNAIINWQGFSIGAGEATRFQQQGASSAVLNRVVGQDPSAILGTLWSNGKVFLVNPNGVLFGQGSRIDVAGLVASTLNITDRDFMAGRLNFQAGTVAGSIVNQGEIVSASGGRIYLIAPDVQNHGLISSPGGEVLLAAGKTVSLVDADVPNLKVEVQAGGEALNVGRILADGGKAGIYAGLINQRGVVRADSVSKDATGKIVFKASDTTILDDGSVTSAAGAKGGEIQVLGNKVGLVGNARIDASGDAGGGTVLIGGDYQGGNTAVQNAYRTYVGPQSSVTADAIMTGDGGKVIVWSDDATRAYGTISAKGGAQGGNGGFVEVSGKNWLDFDAVVNTSAVRGSAGVLLLDPSQVNIVAGADTLSGGAGFDGGSPNNVFDGGSGPSSISWTTIKNHLTGAGGGSNTNVYVTTSGFQCSPAGSCGIDVLAASPDLASSNTLRLISHQHINASNSITNTGSGALEMYAGWDGTSPVTAPVLNNPAGAIAIGAPISFAGNVLLRAYNNIADTVGATITALNLLASSSNGSVNLSNSTHQVGTLAGAFHDQFSFKNGQSLTVGTVGSTSGISTVASPGDAPTFALTVTSGNLLINSPISVTDGGGTTAPTSVTLHALSGGISVNNTSIFASAAADDSNDGQTANLTLTAGGGAILVSNSTVSALGGNPIVAGAGGGANVSLSATGGITANSVSTISATGRAGLGTSQPGGSAQVNLVAGGTVDTSSSALNAFGGAPGSGGVGGVGSAFVGVNSMSGNPTPSGDIIVHNITADNVNLQQLSAGAAKSILRGSGTSLIGATQLLMEVDDPNNVGGGSIGTSAAPMRVQVARLEAHTHEASAGIFIDSPNAQNLQIGGVSFFGGTVKGVQNVVSGDISIGVNGTLTLQSGSPNSPCGTGTGGPICTTSGNVSLRAEDMVIGHAISASGGTVTLAPFSVGRGINFEVSPTAGVLSLSPAEILNVAAATLEIGRTDGTATLSVAAPLEMGPYNALKLMHGDVHVSNNITKSSGADATLSLIANNSVRVFGGADITSSSNKLHAVFNSDADASGAGRIDLGGGTVLTSNGGNVALGGGANPLTGYAVGDGPSGGAQIGVYLIGPTITSGAGNISIRGKGAPGTTNATGVQLDTSAVLQTTTGSITIDGVGGNGTLGGRNRGIWLLDGGTQVTSVSGTITLTGQGGSSTGFATNSFPPPAQIDGRNRGIDIADGPVISTTGNGNIVLTGTGGSSVDQGSNTGVLISQSSPVGTSVSTVNGNITISGSGGTATGASGVATANRGVSIGAAEVKSTGSGSISITGTGGTTNNNSAGSSNSGILVQGDDAFVPGGIQALVTTAGGNLSITGTAGSSTAAGTHEGIIISNNAFVQSGGAGTLTLTGTAVAGVPAIRLSGGGGVVAPMTVHVQAGGTLNVTANGGLLTLDTTGGSLNNELIELLSVGNQTINAPGIVMTGGASGSGSFVGIGAVGAGAGQNITVGSAGISLTGGSGTAANSNALITASGTQAITVNGGGNVTLAGGSGSGNSNFARISDAGTAQTITFGGGGNLVLTGGTVGNLNFAEVRANNATVGAQTQTITGATGITLTGGASGGGVDGSNNSLGNFARINNANGSQAISAGAGGVTLNGGGGTLTSNFALIIQGSVTAGSPGTSQSLTINNGGTLALQGGSSAQTNVINNATNGFRGSYAMVQGNGDSQLISFPNGGAISLTGGTVGSNNPAQIFSRFGLQTITGAPAITLTGGASGGYVDIALNKNEGNFANINSNAGQSIAASSITLSGGGAGVGNHAEMFDGGTTTTQSISATSISLTGGAGGGIDSGNAANAMGNFALIQGSATQTITATGLSLHGGAGGQENFAAVVAPTQTVVVHGNLSLVGGGSATGTLRGGGARIGGTGGNAPAPTDLLLIVDGNLTMTGGSAANSGSAIGSGLVGGQTTAMEIDVGGNVTLNPGTVANAESRIGSPASSIAGGDISITAGGALALNSTGPGLGTAIRTLGNVTLNAASITQGPDSVIIAGGTTTIGGGTVSLPSATNQFGTVLLNTTGNATITDADAIVLGTSTTGSGSLTVTAPGGITQSGPITAGAATFHAGASPIVLTNAGNDFTGPVDLSTSSSAAITDANAFIIQGGGGGGPSTTSLTINANGAVTQSAAFTGSAPAVIVINAGSGPITLNSTGNNFSGNTSVTANTTGAVSLTNGNAGGINLAASTVGGALSLTSGGPVTQSGPVTVGGASTINAGSNAITLTNAANDFTGAVNFTGSNVSITDVNAIAIGNSNASGALNIVATSTSFLNGLNANNYSFSGGTYALAAGTYNLGGTTSVAQNPVTGALTTVDVQSGATINTSGGTVSVGAGGTLKGTGTIQGNVNNVAGTVSPGASPGMLTITGNYTQGASGTLDMQIGGLVAGTDYDQLRVGGATSLAGTLNTALINGFVPVSGQTFTLVQSTGPVTGTFSTVNQPVGALFNSFYGPTTFEFISAASTVLPPPLVVAVNNTIASTLQLNQPVIEVLDKIVVTYVVPATTTTPEGKIVPKPPACN